MWMWRCLIIVKWCTRTGSQIEFTGGVGYAVQSEIIHYSIIEEFSITEKARLVRYYRFHEYIDGMKMITRYWGYEWGATSWLLVATIGPYTNGSEAYGRTKATCICINSLCDVIIIRSQSFTWVH